MIGRDPKWIAAQIGHVSPKFTFSVYQQVATRRYIDEQAVWTMMRFADEPAERSSQPADHAPRTPGSARLAEVEDRASSTEAVERLIDGGEDDAAE